MFKKSCLFFSTVFVLFGCELDTGYFPASSSNDQLLGELKTAEGQVMTIETRLGIDGTIYYVPQPQTRTTDPGSKTGETTSYVSRYQTRTTEPKSQTDETAVPVLQPQTRATEPESKADEPVVSAPQPQTRTTEPGTTEEPETAEQLPRIECSKQKIPMPLQAPSIVPVCERTTEVKMAILQAVGKTHCSQVTLADLNLRRPRGLNSDFRINNLTGVKAGDFSGLVVGHNFVLQDSRLNVPSGAFSNLIVKHNLSLKNSQLSLSSGAFSNLFVCHDIRLENDQISSLPPNSFSNSFIGHNLSLKNSQLSLSSGAFSNLIVGHDIRLENSQLNILSGVFSNLTVGHRVYLDDGMFSEEEKGLIRNEYPPVLFTEAHQKTKQLRAMAQVKKKKTSSKDSFWKNILSRLKKFFSFLQ